MIQGDIPILADNLHLKFIYLLLMRIGYLREDKLRKLTNGGKRKHVYYHCTRSKDRKCKEPYISERDLIKLLLKITREILDKKIIINNQLKESMKEYERIIKEANYLSKYEYDG